MSLICYNAYSFVDLQSESLSYFQILQKILAETGAKDWKMDFADAFAMIISAQEQILRRIGSL